jgi:hypothetical protein
MRIIHLVLLLGLLSVSSPWMGWAQGAPAVPAQVVALGNSTVALTGPWKFHTGDNLGWADPNFDDSVWRLMDLAPPPGS